MQTMGATAMDVAREFQMRLEKVQQILAAAFVEYIPSRNQFMVSTLIDEEDPAAERELAQIELDIEEAFREFSLDFSTVHLRGRKIEEFIPAEALVIYRRWARPSSADAAVK